MASNDDLNRLLLITNGFWRPDQTQDGELVWRKDESRIPLVLEACLASAVSRVAVPAWSALADEVTRLPEPLQRMVTLVDHSGRAFRRLSAFMEPVREEFNVYLSIEFDFPVMIGDPPNESVRGPLLFTLEPLLDFFLGLEYGLQITRQPKHMLEAVEDVLSQSRSPNTRARLSFLAGALRTYRPAEIDGLAVQTSGRPDFMQEFLEMVEDETYRELSRQARLWGVTEHSRRALQKFQRLARAFVSRSPFAKTLQLGRQIVSTTTGLSFPGEEEISQLLSPDHAPAMVDMKPVWKRARSALQTTRTRRSSTKLR